MGLFFYFINESKLCLFSFCCNTSAIHPSLHITIHVQKYDLIYHYLYTLIINVLDITKQTLCFKCFSHHDNIKAHNVSHCELVCVETSGWYLSTTYLLVVITALAVYSLILKGPTHSHTFLKGLHHAFYLFSSYYHIIYVLKRFFKVWGKIITHKYPSQVISA